MLVNMPVSRYTERKTGGRRYAPFTAAFAHRHPTPRLSRVTRNIDFAMLGMIRAFWRWATKRRKMTTTRWLACRESDHGRVRSCWRESPTLQRLLLVDQSGGCVQKNCLHYRSRP